MFSNSSVSKISLISAVFLVTSNMLGSGIYMLPAILAKVGGISIIAWGGVLIGIISFALVMAKLSLIIPNGVGPYSFAKEAMGKAMGYHTNIIYSIANWVALVSMPTIVVGYLQNILPLFANMWVSVTIQIVVIWVFTIINICGVKWIVRMQVFGFAIALVPILTISTVGWFYFDSKIFFSGFNVTGVTPVHAITNSFNSIMWAFIGVESACVTARLVSNPKRNILLATVAGVLIAGVIYISTCMVMLGIIPAVVLSKSSAPFADCLAVVFNSPKIGVIVSIIAIADVLGAMGGWCLVTGQTAQLAASDGLFPGVFAKTNSRDMPSTGLKIMASFMSLVVLVTASPTAQVQFNKIISMSVLLYLIPYVYSNISLLILGKKNNISWIYFILAVVAGGFFIWSIYLTDIMLLKYAMIVIVLSLPMRAIFKK